MSRISRLAVLMVALFFHGGAIAQQTAERYTREMDYLLYLPPGYGTDTTKLWPMLVYLHGAGETGHDLARLRLRGLPSLIEHGRKLPFIVVSPQTDTVYRWGTDDLYHFVLDMSKKFRVNPEQIWLTGISMGGFAVWDLAISHPELFAAIVPISKKVEAKEWGKSVVLKLDGHISKTEPGLKGFSDKNLWRMK